MEPHVRHIGAHYGRLNFRSELRKNARGRSYTQLVQLSHLSQECSHRYITDTDAKRHRSTQDREHGRPSHSLEVSGYFPRSWETDEEIVGRIASSLSPAG